MPREKTVEIEMNGEKVEVKMRSLTAIEEEDTFDEAGMGMNVVDGKAHMVGNFNKYIRFQVAKSIQSPESLKGKPDVVGALDGAEYTKLRVGYLEIKGMKKDEKDFLSTSS